MDPRGSLGTIIWITYDQLIIADVVNLYCQQAQSLLGKRSYKKCEADKINYIAVGPSFDKQL